MWKPTNHSIKWMTFPSHAQEAIVRNGERTGTQKINNFVSAKTVWAYTCRSILSVFFRIMFLQIDKYPNGGSTHHFQLKDFVVSCSPPTPTENGWLTPWAATPGGPHWQPSSLLCWPSSSSLWTSRSPPSSSTARRTSFWWVEKSCECSFCVEQCHCVSVVWMFLCCV